MKGLRLVVAAAAVVVCVGSVRPAHAEYGDDAGWGVLAVLANLGYMPAKTVYAVFGGLTGGLAYVCTGGDAETAQNIWEASLGGTYVLSPAMLRGEQPIAFAGDVAVPPLAQTGTTDLGSDSLLPPATSGRSDESLPAS